MELSGHRVLITGGGSGVGLELARALTRLGNDVLVCGRSADRLDAAARAVPGLRTTVCDLADPAALPRLVDDADRLLGGLSLLVNNAAVQRAYQLPGRPVAEALDDIDYEIATDLLAPLKLTALALPLLTRRPVAAVVNLTSALAVSPRQNAAVYAAAKAGLRTFTKALRYQLEAQAPHVRAVEAMLPLVDTPMTTGRGSGKISAARAAEGVLAGLRADRTLIAVGRTRMFLLLHRLAPAGADALLREG